MSSFLKKSGRLGGAKSKVSSSPDADLPADWMAQAPSSSSSSSPQPTQDAAAARKRREEAEADAEAERRRLLNVNRYAAGGGGGGGGAAFTKMRKQEQSRLEKMQNQTFTRWVNLQLHAGGGGTAPMADLVQGLASGENLLRLLSVLSRKNASSSSSLPGGEVRKGTPSLGGVGSRFQSLGNVEQAFKFMKEEGIPLIGIGPQDVSQGNLKLILGMMWSIIQHYRLVNLFDEPPAQHPNTPASSAQSTSSGTVAAKQGETREEQQRTSAKSDDGAQKSDKAAGAKDEITQAAGEAVSPSAADERAVENKGDKKADTKAAKKDDKKKDKDSKKEKKLQAKEEKATAKKDVKKAKAEPAAAKQTETVRPSSAVAAEKARETTGAPGQPAIKAATAARQPQQSVESSLLEWVRDKLADAPEGEKLQVNNVKELFADGRALPVLVNTIQPGSVDVKALDVKKPIENNKLALRAATEKLAVPALIEGDDLANGADVDGLSLILYLSYLKQADAHKVQAKEEANHAKQEATAAVETKAIEPASVHTSDSGEKSKADGNVKEKERNETKRDEATTAKMESEAETKTMEQANVIKNEEGKSKAEAEALTADAAAVVAVAKENVPETAGEALAPASDGGDSKHAANKRPSSSQDFDAAPAAAPTSDEREVKTNERVETIASKPSHEESEQQREATTNAHDEKSKKEEKKKTKKDKKTKKTKKSKKGKDAGGEDGNNKKNKKTKASSKAVSAPVPAVKEVEPTTASTPDIVPAGPNEAPAPAAKKALAPLPHSRLPTRGEDLSYLAGPSAGAPVRKPHSIQLAAIPERKKPVTTTVTAGVDPVSAFWYE